MSGLFKSRLGYFASGTYLFITLLMIFLMGGIFALRYSTDNTHGYPLEETVNIVTLVLTLPWSVISTVIAVALPLHTGRLVLVVLSVIAAMINASIFYFLGYLLSKAFNYLTRSQ
jgi:hypothetical protein